MIPFDDVIMHCHMKWELIMVYNITSNDDSWKKTGYIARISLPLT